MKVDKIDMLLEKGEFIKSDEFQLLRSQILLAIEAVEWHQPGKFVINPVIHGNGVNPIKENFVKTLKNEGWRTEVTMKLVDGIGPGPIDAIKETAFGFFAVEWETGNVSSSHRALNKIAIGTIQKNLIGGILVVPKKSFAKYLTDRIGNYEELQPYFPLYKRLAIEDGAIGVIVVDYDELDKTAPFIRKGKDGNAKKDQLAFEI